MLSSSEVAARYKISNRQVHDLVNYGYLNVAQVFRNEKRGVSFLFSENEIEKLDIPSLIAEMKEKKIRNIRPPYSNSSDFKKILRAFDYYDRFMEDVNNLSEGNLLKAAFYLFHFNHYAKTYPEMSKELYKIKSRVLRKMYLENQQFIKASYLLGPDRKKVWLCEDCKDASRSAGMSYNTYIRSEAYCPKCDILELEKEYYSLVEFCLEVSDYRFIFHTPRSLAVRWMKDIDELPRDNRKTGQYDDRMYLYGRAISRIEERVFPLEMLKEKLEAYIRGDELSDE